MTANPSLPEITPLQERAIRRFEHDRDFYIRCYSAAHALELTPHDAATDLAVRLRTAMTALQEADEAVHDEESIVRGATYIGNELLGVFYATASVPEQEGLKAAARRVLVAVENRP